LYKCWGVLGSTPGAGLGRKFSRGEPLDEDGLRKAAAATPRGQQIAQGKTIKEGTGFFKRLALLLTCSHRKKASNTRQKGGAPACEIGGVREGRKGHQPANQERGAASKPPSPNPENPTCNLRETAEHTEPVSASEKRGGAIRCLQNPTSSGK